MSKSKKKETYFSEELIEAARSFGVYPEIELKKSERKVIDILADEGGVDFLELCISADFKPSKLMKILTELEDLGLIDVEDDELISLSETCLLSIDKDRHERKNDKKFLKFLASLDKAELDEFCGLCEDFDFMQDEDEEDLPEIEAEVYEEGPEI